MKTVITVGNTLKYRGKVYLVHCIHKAEMTQVAEMDSVEDGKFRVSNPNADYLDTQVEPYTFGDVITIKSHMMHLRCQGSPSFDICLYYHVTKEKREDEQAGTDSSSQPAPVSENERLGNGLEDRNGMGDEGPHPAD